MKIFFLAGADSINSYRRIKYFSDKGYDIYKKNKNYSTIAIEGEA